MTTTTRMPRSAAGELVRQALMAIRPNGATKAELADETRLTLSQVANGITWIREFAAAEHLTPLTYTRADGYRFSEEPADWIDFERATMLRMLTSIRRTLTGVAYPHVQLMPNDAMASWMNTQFDSLSKTIEITLSLPPHGGGASRLQPTPS